MTEHYIRLNATGVLLRCDTTARSSARTSQTANVDAPFTRITIVTRIIIRNTLPGYS